MNRINKLLQRFFKNPDSVKYSDIEIILSKFGFIKSYGKGSHRNFRHLFMDIKITIPVHDNDCLPFYKRKLAKILKAKLSDYGY